MVEEKRKRLLSIFLPAVALTAAGCSGYRLMTAARAGDAQEISALLAKQTPLDIIDLEGRSPLHAAALSGRLEAVRALLEAGAPVNARDRLSRTPLYLAAEHGYADIVRELLGRGADPEIKDRKGQTPPAAACRAGGPGCAAEETKDAFYPWGETSGRTRELLKLAKSKISSLAAKDQERLERGLILLRPGGSGAKLAPSGRQAASGAYAGALLLAQELVKADRRLFSGPKPRAPKLEQTKYEAVLDFDARVARKKKEYQEGVARYNERIKSYPQWRRNALLEQALSLTLSPLSLSPHTDYDPDSRLFSVAVVSQNPQGKDFRERFALTQNVSNAEAPDFDRKLGAAAVAGLLFRRQGQNLTLASAQFRAPDGKAYDALPTSTNASSKSSRQVADVSSIGAPSEEVPIESLNIRYEPNPELQKELSRVQGALVDHPDYRQAEDASKYALVIGIAHYQGLPTAEFADRDALAVRAHLRAMGFPERHIFFLSDERATKGKIEAHLDRLADNVDSKSTVFFYYSGHGAPDPETGKAYLVPADGDPSYLKSSAYPLSELYGRLSGLAAKRVVVAMDACFSGLGGRSVLAKARPLVTTARNEAITSPRLVALVASAGDQIAGPLAEAEHGAFTYYLLKGLNGDARDKNGHVSMRSLYRYLAPKVEDAARRENHDQKPQLLFSPGNEEIAEERLR